MTSPCCSAFLEPIMSIVNEMRSDAQTSESILKFNYLGKKLYFILYILGLLGDVNKNSQMNA